MPDRDVAPRAGAESAPGPSSSPTLDEAMAQARPGDPASLLLAQARITEALFGTAPDVGLGRFRIVRRLGAGGMGTVYAAYDPELDRGVALKLVDVPQGGRELALAEAKALAKLSHPNVVPVFDVGLDGDHVYIVMELVRGETLRAWVEGREVGEVLEAYRQAGLALAAAHAAGLVHRDFKPDNAVVGADGRVRVVDFGLACEADGPDRPAKGRRSIAGTPRYMAPEQAAGGAVTAAADQFGFCRSLHEALTRPGAEGGPRALPRWLGAVVERGLAADPAARYPSMRELVAALGRDPVRVWRRRLGAIALGLVGAAGAFFVGRATPSGGGEACSGGEGELATAWPPADRAAAIARIGGLGGYGKGLAPWLDGAIGEYTARWAGGRKDACFAHRRGAQSDALFDRRMVCLERGRVALAEVAAIAGAADAKSLPHVALAFRALPDPGACADAAALLADVEPPPPAQVGRVAAARAELERARVRLAAGRPAAARDIGVAAVRDARATGYEPLLAEALLVEGRARLALPARQAATAPLAEATRAALAAGADAIAVEAWARNAWAVGTGGDPGAALAGLELIEAVAARASSGGFARALLFNNVGSVAMAADQPERARAAFERALHASRGVAGPGAIELVAVRVNAAVLSDDPARRADLLGDAASELERLLGRDHPRTLHVRWVHATSSVTELAQAARLVEAICEGHELHEEPDEEAADCWPELGEIRFELGDVAGARGAFERAAARALPGWPTSPTAPYLALFRGDAAAASDRFARALAPLPAGDDVPWWRRLQRGELRLGLGRAHRAAGDEAGARRALEASAADLAFVVAKRPVAQIERKLARARAELARAMAATGARPADVAAVAAPAAAWLGRAGGAAGELAALERLAAPR